MSEYTATGEPAEIQLTAEERALRDYYAWHNRTRQVEADERSKHATIPEIRDRKLLSRTPPWEAEGLSDEQRQQLYTLAGLQKQHDSAIDFSPAAHMAVLSPEAAHFLDEVKCNYLGDSNHLGWFKEISPQSNDSPFDVQFNYSVGIVNHYTDAGMIVHVRETLDPAATTREQKLFIVTANLITGELKRLYAQDQTTAEPSPDVANGFDETVNLKPRLLDTHIGQGNQNIDNPFVALYQHEIDRLAAMSQPKLKYLARGAVAYQVEGYASFSDLHPIKKLDEQRHYLGMLALAAGHPLNSRGAIEPPPSQLSIA